MPIDGILVLPADLVLTPVAELAEEVRVRLGGEPGDYALTRPGSRTPSRLVDAAAARLLRQFATPCTIVEAVVAFSRAGGGDPERTLEEAFPLLEGLWHAGFLVEAGSAAAARLAPSLAPGERWCGWEVAVCLQVTEDVELFQVRRGTPARQSEEQSDAEGAEPFGVRGGTPGRQSEEHSDTEDAERFQVRGGAECAALKVLRREAPPAVAARLAREAALLTHLAAAGEAPAPRLLVCGGFDGLADLGLRPYLVIEWCEGVDAAVAAGELRQERASGRRDLLRLCRAVAGAYARLHRRGVLHGDVHPRNVLVAADGTVRLIDFDLGARHTLTYREVFVEMEGDRHGFGGATDRRGPGGAGEPRGPRGGGKRRGPGGGGERQGLGGAASGEDAGRSARGGIGFFFEPEYARAVRAGEPPPAVSAAGEQHAVGALLHLLVTGVHYLDFSLAREEMLRQIAEQPPSSWQERGIEPWPELEALLARALAKSPDARFDGMAGLAAALDELAEPPPAAPAGAGWTAGRSAEALLDRTLETLRPEGALYTQGLPPPGASVAFGAAGVACALYRVALARRDAMLLADADVWAARACAASGPEAFYSAALGITPATGGRISLYHGAAGPPAVQALIAHAMGEPAAQAVAIGAFAALASAAGVTAPPDSTVRRLSLTGPSAAAANPPAATGADRGLTAAAHADARSAPPAGGFPYAEAGAGAACGFDLALGRSGLLLGAALLLDTAGAGTAERATLTALGDGLLGDLWRHLDAMPPIAAAGRPNLGMAHGWAGSLYATLRWHLAAGCPLPAGLGSRLAGLAAAAQRWGRGVRWRWFDGEEGGGWPARSMPGWCNGSAGFVYLWTAAHEALGEPLHRELALGAAWNAWEEGEGGGTLCCGLAGRAYSLLHLYRHEPEVGAGPWLVRAQRLAARAAREIADSADPPHSLYKGALGVATLAADLAAPDDAAMPLFDAEGWPDQRRSVSRLW